MKIVGVIPARFQSTRMPGKPLADICGKPMIWWVYRQVAKVTGIAEIYIATDDQRIASICDSFHMKYIMTSDHHPDHISRVQEVSDRIQADYYICVNGDEPLIDPRSIEKLLPTEKKDGFYFGGAMRILTDPAQTIDFANIKIAVNKDNRAIYMSRTPVPYPRGSLNFSYRKYVGIECFNKMSLDFFVKHEMGCLEKAEDIDHLRFLENGMPMQFYTVDSESLSVDTPKDLEFVKTVIQKKIETGELSNE